MNREAFLLFADNSFLSGAAQAFDLGATFTQYNMLDSEEEADILALASDWRAVGEDIWFAIEKVECQDADCS